jgi:hypothetical protein
MIRVQKERRLSSPLVAPPCEIAKVRETVDLFINQQCLKEKQTHVPNKTLPILIAANTFVFGKSEK